MFLSIPFLSPVCPASQLARAGRLSERSRDAFVDEVVTGGAERAPKRAQRGTPHRAGVRARLGCSATGPVQAVNGALWLRAERAVQPWPVLITPATLPRSTPSPKTSTHTAS